MKNKSYAHARVGRRNCVSVAGQAARPTGNILICGLKPCKRKRGPRKKRTRGKRARKRGRRWMCERLRLSGISIGYCNIRGIRGSRYSLEKFTEAFAILLFQETKLRNGTTFALSDFVFPPDGVSNLLAYAHRRNSICTVTFLDSTTFTTDDSQFQILTIHDPRLHKPLTLVNLYDRGGSAADSC